ncbi:aspartate carbamoyltransferase [Patescibacteria group bacterium]
MEIKLDNKFLPLGVSHNHKWTGQSVLSVKQFDRADLEYIFGLAHAMRLMRMVIGSCDLLKGSVLANLFYEPSTRTSSSFTAAMERLGGSLIPINEVKFSSVSKGESLPDTIRTLEQYVDVIVLRHPEMGSAAIAAEVAKKPVLNAGDGVGEHPTQAFLDGFTIFEELGFDGSGQLTVTMLGDLKYGRTVHSLARLLTLFDIKLNYVSPEILRMPKDVMDEVAAKNIPQNECDSLEKCLAETDVLYVTRVQRERFENPADYEKVAGSFVVDTEIMKAAKDDMIVMHPLPRVGEISTDFDKDPRAAYFRQMEYGLYVRMALLAMVLGKA